MYTYAVLRVPRDCCVLHLRAIYAASAREPACVALTGGNTQKLIRREMRQKRGRVPALMFTSVKTV